MLTNTSGCGGVDNVLHDLANTITETEPNNAEADEVEAALAVVVAAAEVNHHHQLACNTNTCPSELINTPLHCI